MEFSSHRVAQQEMDCRSSVPNPAVGTALADAAGFGTDDLRSISWWVTLCLETLTWTRAFLATG